MNAVRAMHHAIGFRHRFLPAIALIAAAIPASATGHAQDGNFGKALYDKHCLVCHGASGKGDGPLAQTTLQKVADISRLSRNNNGVLPYDYLYKVIDGRDTDDTHGPRDMPHWGLLYADEAKPGVTKEEFVRARITALIAHIATLQTK
jgi:mono/diheme cytochrome c family protein